jgi:hypothetical protein
LYIASNTASIQSQCELEYQATGQLRAGKYAVALQIEDFASPTDSTPLSSVPVQFAIHLFTPTPNQPCSSRPELVGTTPLDGSCIGVPFSSSWSTTITAQLPYDSTATSITDIATVSPPGMRISELVQSKFNNPREWQMIITWTPLSSHSGPNIFCYYALDNTGYYNFYYIV